MWYIFRHGETFYNKYQICQGRHSSILTLKGIDQAKSYAYRLLEQEEDLNKFKFLTSPMIRTRETIQIICEVINVNVYEKVQEEYLLSEVECGTLTNLTKSHINQNYKENEYNTLDILNYQYPNGESYNDVYQRAEEFMEKYKNEKNLIIVTHGSLFVFLKSILLKEPRNNLTINDLYSSQNYFIKYDGKNINII